MKVFKKLVVAFFVLSMFMFFNVGFSPIVLGDGTPVEYYTGFEGATLDIGYDYTWGDGTRIVTSSVDTPDAPDGVFSIETASYSGTRGFVLSSVPAGNEYGWWNFTFGQIGQITNFTFWFRSTSTDYYSTFKFYNQTLYLNDPTSNPFIILAHEHSSGPYTDGSVSYENNEGGKIELHSHASGLWSKIGFEIDDNDEVSYIFHNSTLDLYTAATPRNTSYTVNDTIDCILFYAAGVGTVTNTFDDINFSLGPAWGTDILEGYYNPLYKGDITINVFNESNTSESLTEWGVQVYDQAGVIYHSVDGLSNPYVINTSSIGDGPKFIEINASGYYNRTFYADLEYYVNYTIDAFLPATSSGANLYYIQTVDEYSEGVGNVDLTISRGLNGTFQELASGLTNSYGMYAVYLIPSLTHIANLSHSDYDDLTMQYFTPDPNAYGIDNPIQFQMDTTVDVVDVLTVGDVITFYGVIDVAGIITVTYSDLNSKTINTNISIGEYYNGVFTLNVSFANVSESDITIVSSGYNISQNHRLILYGNHSDLGSFYTVYDISAIRTLVDEDTIEGYFEDVFGEFELGWVKFFLIFTPALFFLIVFGAGHPGLGVMSAGMYLAFTGYFLDVGSIVEYGAIAGILVVMGFMLIVAKKGRDVL